MSFLTQIKLKNFKCFKDETTFPLAQFNLLTGINGKGKSSLLQSLLLMRQSIEHNEQTDCLILNGSCVTLGTMEDVKNSNTLKEHDTIFEFIFSNTKEQLRYNINTNEVDPFTGMISSFAGNTITDKTDYKWQKKSKQRMYRLYPEDFINRKETGSLFDFQRIHYVAADRIGPQNFYEKKTLGRFINAGPRGENVVNVIHQKEQESFLVNDSLYLGKDAKTIEQQVQEWLCCILGETRLEIKGKEQESSVLTLLLGDSKSPRKYKASNMGFGYSYILPIIVSSLIAKPDELLIIENPEAHLHPRAQSLLIQFLVKVALTGVQVFVETHSDHILNALRICIKEKKIPIKNKDVSILTFQDIPENFVIPIQVEEDGSIDNWPENFFDQNEKDLKKLIGF